MIGDTRGYDPGGKMVPLAAATAIALLSLFLLVRAATGNPSGGEQTGHAGLVVANIVISALFIFLFRHAGYILTTCLVLYWLIVLNLRALDRQKTWGGAVTWMCIVLAYTIASYSLLRFAVRRCFWIARTYEMPLMREPVLHALVAAVVLALCFVLVGKLLRRCGAGMDAILTAQISVATTLFIYVVFRQLFLVQLPTGLLNW